MTSSNGFFPQVLSIHMMIQTAELIPKYGFNVHNNIAQKVLEVEFLFICL